MDETTADERLGHMEGRHFCQCGKREPCFTRRLIADVERPTTEIKKLEGEILDCPATNYHSKEPPKEAT